MANFLFTLGEVRGLRSVFLPLSAYKMPPRRCVVQDCNQVSNKDLGISMHTSPASGSERAKWKRFVCRHRNFFSPKGTFGVCSLHFTNDCFTRAVHIKGTERRLKPGSVPTIWKKATVSLSGRSRRRVSRIFAQSVVFAYLLLLSCNIRHSWNTHTHLNMFWQPLQGCFGWSLFVLYL